MTMSRLAMRRMYGPGRRIYPEALALRGTWVGYREEGYTHPGRPGGHIYHIKPLPREARRAHLPH